MRKGRAIGWESAPFPVPGLVPVRELIPISLLADATKARECRAIQTLRDLGCGFVIAKRLRVRRIPPLLKATAVSGC
jgi:hypothetical protein